MFLCLIVDVVCADKMSKNVREFNVYLTHKIQTAHLYIRFWSKLENNSWTHDFFQKKKKKTNSWSHTLDHIKFHIVHGVFW